MRRRPRFCACDAPVIWARDDAGRWVEIDGQSTLDRSVADPLVLWWVTTPGARQRVSRLADFERLHGRHDGPVWQIHFAVCEEADRPPVRVLAPVPTVGIIYPPGWLNIDPDPMGRRKGRA